MLLRSSRGGVPVLSRPHSNPNDFSDSASSRDGGSPAPGRTLFGPDVNQPIQERPGGDDERAALATVPVFHRQADDATVIDEDASGLSKDPGDVRLAIERACDPGRIATLVGLRARRPDRGPTTAIEQLELNPGCVDGVAHEAAEGINLANEVALGRAAHCGVTRHVRDGLARQRAKAHVAPKTSRRIGRLHARMPRADDDDVEPAHLPMQNRSKIWRRTSSDVRTPRFRRAVCVRPEGRQSTNSSGVSPALPQIPRPRATRVPARGAI